jgi:hypothetical protein
MIDAFLTINDDLDIMTASFFVRSALLSILSPSLLAQCLIKASFLVFPFGMDVCLITIRDEGYLHHGLASFIFVFWLGGGVILCLEYRGPAREWDVSWRSMIVFVWSSRTEYKI